jgi:hypothetical protein
MPKSSKPSQAQLNEGSRRNRGRRSARVFDLLEGVIRRSTYVLLALGGFTASLKILRDMIVACFGK